jgi:hypothetical protein
MKVITFNSGDRVSHKGNLWNVVYQSGGIVKIIRDGMTRTVKLDKIKLVESIR